MTSRDDRTALRIAVYSSDGAAVLELLRSDWPADALQLIGDGLIGAVTKQVTGAAELGRQCVAALHERAWDGDHELATHLESLLGTGPTPLLRRVPVDLEDLALVLEGDPLSGDGRMDLRTGEVWSPSEIEYLRESGEEDEDSGDDPERWLRIRNTGSRAGYLDMRDFADTVSDSDRADRLNIALQGRGAFRRFKDVLGRWPEELERWYAFSDDRRRGRARAWLAEEGYRADAARTTPPDP